MKIGINFMVLIGFELCAGKAFFDPPILLTKEQANKLEEYKKNAAPLIKKGTLIYNTSRDDLYFIRWLDGFDWDVGKTLDYFKRHLEWREKEAIDKIDEEDWTSFAINYPIFFGGHDKTGRPLAEIWISEWDVRKAVLKGEIHRLSRWFVRMYEIQQRSVHKLRQAGRNITQAVLLYDLEQFAAVTHLCGGCLQIYENMGKVWEQYYPNLLQSVITINTTPTFRAVVGIMTPLTKPSVTSSLHLYTGRETWEQVLDKKFDKDQLSERFGGTIIREDY